MNLENLFSIICYLFIAIMFFIDYFKHKKVYTLLTVVVISIYFFFKTPFASSINKIAENILIMIMLILIFTTFYLLVKEHKEKKK